MQAGGDFQGGDAGDFASGVGSLNFFQDATFGDGDHHYAAGVLLAGPIGALETEI